MMEKEITTASGALNRPNKVKRIVKQKKLPKKKVILNAFPSHADFCRMINR